MNLVSWEFKLLKNINKATYMYWSYQAISQIYLVINYHRILQKFHDTKLTMFHSAKYYRSLFTNTEKQKRYCEQTISWIRSTFYLAKEWTSSFHKCKILKQIYLSKSLFIRFGMASDILHSLSGQSIYLIWSITMNYTSTDFEKHGYMNKCLHTLGRELQYMEDYNRMSRTLTYTKTTDRARALETSCLGVELTYWPLTALSCWLFKVAIWGDTVVCGAPERITIRCC